MNRQKREALRGGAHPDETNRPTQAERSSDSRPQEQIKGGTRDTPTQPKHGSDRPAGRLPLPE